VAKVESMIKIFWEATAFSGGGVGNWDTGLVGNMNGAFYGVVSLDEDLSQWNVARVRDFQHLFNGCEKFNSDLSQWETGNVTDMSFAFFGTSLFSSDLSLWDTSKVKILSWMVRMSTATPTLDYLYPFLTYLLLRTAVFQCHLVQQ
jgi:surface protein